MLINNLCIKDMFIFECDGYSSFWLKFNFNSMFFDCLIGYYVYWFFIKMNNVKLYVLRRK